MKRLSNHPKEAGFTLMEIMITVAIIGIVSAMAAPSFLSWLPKYRLKSAARELYTTFQHTRLLAVRQNTPARLTFVANAVAPGYYIIDLNANGIVDLAGEKRINLAKYKSGVDFGFTAGLMNWGGGPVVNAITYPPPPPPPPLPPFCTYNSNGTATNGTVYLINNQNNTVYAITTVTSGAVKLRRYDGTNWE